VSTGSLIHIQLHLNCLLYFEHILFGNSACPLKEPFLADSRHLIGHGLAFLSLARDRFRLSSAKELVYNKDSKSLLDKRETRQ
jgi:hypothetical protein